ncbi:MAG: tRNA (guanosine(46)-N7)-methyltransferase TrmB [Marinilabiliales bacterium]|nr:MAG: tRNA (guanosine(46)-N7)-methyltransferase TrmB [Marinilabiliales bacterium]
MGQKNKLQKFAENLTFDNLFQFSYDEIIDGIELKGKWAKDFFKNDNEIILELGCGKGEYTIGLAELYPDKNFIGIDIKGARLWKGLKECRNKSLKNVAFIRSRINLVDGFFGKDEISQLWITFPDPHARDTIARKRLTSPEFIKRYTKFLKKDAIINLKTDNIIVFESTLDTIEEYSHKLLYKSYDIYNEGVINELTSIQTFYEKKWLEHGTKIKFLKFELNPKVFN